MCYKSGLFALVTHYCLNILNIFLNLTFLRNLKSTSSRLVVQINEATAFRTDLDCGESECDVSVCNYSSQTGRLQCI